MDLHNEKLSYGYSKPTNANIFDISYSKTNSGIVSNMQSNTNLP